MSPVETFRVDQAVAGFALSPASLGLYVVGLAISNLPRFLAQGITTIAYAETAADKEVGSVGRKTIHCSAVTLAVVGAVVVGLEVALSTLVRLLFGEFTGAALIARCGAHSRC